MPILKGLAMVLFMATLLTNTGCSPARHVQSGQYLLDRVTLHIEDSTETITSQAMMPYVHQRPNNRFLHISRLRLGVYNLSGKDSTKWWNKWVRKLGEAPVVYDPAATRRDSAQLVKAMNNAGFMHASVNVDTIADSRKRSMRLTYRLRPGQPHIISGINYVFPDDSLRREVMRDSDRFIVRKGQRLDRESLEQQRDWIVQRLRNRGYWGMTKEFLTFTADTTEANREAELTMTLHPPYPEQMRKVAIDSHTRYRLGGIFVMAGADTDNLRKADTVNYRDLTIIYPDGERWISASTIYNNCKLQRGQAFRQRDVDNTYSSFGRLPILKLTQVKIVPTKVPGVLEAWILLTPGKSQTISLELEGTNSEGDLGMAAGINYSHRNLMHGSETLDLKIRGSYQALNGHLEGFIHDRYVELSTEASITLPKFVAPFLHSEFKKKVRASTELHISGSYQERPEFTRIISTAGASYKWSEHSGRFRYTLTPIDISYVYLPESTNDFLDKIAPDNPLLRYSYEDHFLMMGAFNFYYTNKRKPSPFRSGNHKDIVWVRAIGETSGNVLFSLTRALDPHRDFHRDPYKVFGIRYAQYARIDVDAAYTHFFDKRNSLAVYGALGIGVPYGNSRMLPFEKRFYGGGANGVRGWDVRTLGPGRFPGSNSVSDFIFQCGDIKMNLSLEYRAKLFWILEGALFVDFGNIWTIHDYESQPYGEFKLDSFYKEFAAAYGVGLRLDFNYFLVRLDLGMKAHNPAINAEPWPLIHPKWGRDRSIHFSIGYPF